MPDDSSQHHLAAAAGGAARGTGWRRHGRLALGAGVDKMFVGDEDGTGADNQLNILHVAAPGLVHVVSVIGISVAGTGSGLHHTGFAVPIDTALAVAKRIQAAHSRGRAGCVQYPRRESNAFASWNAGNYRW